ncbi:copper amine oxidase [Desulfallas sp. Bu1-1]|uniref:stalk domain-containing protein n=1 Tax=Desulfallas sp. Bu1-1 TaxID=2787620 RepID=UPI00189F0BDA|nr:stalk domain-containing protein [Desulfallas sp. Bu1-1]MBF7081758.1 copper amine oxidase [Desulfallas sp. Bu1-1]
MKRISIIALVLLLSIGVYLIPRAAAQERSGVEILLDGLPVASDVPPTVHHGRTMVPFRAVAEALNIAVTWDGQTKSIIAKNNETTLELKVSQSTAYRNQQAIPLDVPPLIIEERTLIPLRFFAEAFGCSVKWDGAGKKVVITSPPKSMQVIGFYALGDAQTSSWKNLFGTSYPEAGRGNTGALSELALGWYSLDEEGTLVTRSRTGWQRPEGWENVLRAAEKYQLKTEMVIHATDYNSAISTFLNNEALMAKAVAAIKEEATKYDGVNIDFEGLGWRELGTQLEKTRNNFTGFIRKLSEQLKPLNINLTLTLHAPNSAYPGYDYRALGQIADRIIIMAYDYGAKPEPANLVIQAVQMARASVPSEKLVLGISAPSETPESMAVKIGIAKRYNLNGIALWRLGLVTDEMWKVVENSVEPKF